MRVELYDEIINFMGLSEPKEFNYFNFDSNVMVAPDGRNARDGGTESFEVMMNLSSKVIVQKRIVYDIFMMFGDVGGLRDFISIFLSAIFGLFSSNFLNSSILMTLFHVMKE